MFDQKGRSLSRIRKFQHDPVVDQKKNLNSINPHAVGILNFKRYILYKSKLARDDLYSWSNVKFKIKYFL